MKGRSLGFESNSYIVTGDLVSEETKHILEPVKDL